MVRAGETLRVTDLEGRQVADFVCFNQHDHAERFSAAKTRLNLFKTRISTGDQLYSNRSEVMFTIGADTVGVHDLLFASCNRWLYANLFDQPGNTGCLEILHDALAPHGITEDALPDPFNLFMKTSVDAANNLAIELPESDARRLCGADRRDGLSGGGDLLSRRVQRLQRRAHHAGRAQDRFAQSCVIELNRRCRSRIAPSVSRAWVGTGWSADDLRLGAALSLGRHDNGVAGADLTTDRCRNGARAHRCCWRL